MTDSQYQEVVAALVAFVTRVAEQKATPEEVTALPGVIHELFALARQIS